MTATFTLTRRPDHMCDGTGESAVTVFTDQDGKITLWHELPRAPQPMRRRPDGRLAAARSFVMRGLGMTFYRRLEWYERRFGVDIPLVEAGVPLEPGFLDLETALGWTSVHPHLDAAEVRKRFARGDRCHGSRYDGRLVTASWISTGTARIDYLGLTLTLPADAFYHYDRYTVPDLRGLHIAPATGSHLGRALAAEGLTMLTCTVLQENVSALQNVLGFDMHRTATIGWFGIGPLHRTFRRPRNS